MAYTKLSLIGTPGRWYSFSPKEEAIPGAVPHTGLFTAQSVSATPGKIHSFNAKTEATPEAEEHTGLFTQLSPIAISGRRLSFLAKATAEIAVEADIKGGWVNPMEAIEDDHRLLVIRDDEEVIGIITTIMTSGIL